MFKQKVTLLLAFFVIFLTGCKLDQMVKLAEKNNLKVTPNPLEVHANKVDFELAVDLPPKMLPKNTEFVITTIYKYDNDKEVSVGSVSFLSNDFPNSATTVSTKKEIFSFPYAEGMNPGILYIEGEAKDVNNGKSKKTERMEVGRGLIMTAKEVEDVSLASYAPHYYDGREELISTAVDFYFDKGKANLRISLAYEGQVNKARTQKLDAFIAAKNVTRTVTVTGTHSPEGTETINSNLSEDRAKTIEKFYRKKMKEYDYSGVADSIEFILKPIVQEWSYFKSVLAEYGGVSDEEKNQYYNIINGSGSFVEKENEFKKLKTYKKILKEIYPGLRSAKTEVLTVKPKKTVAEIAVLSKAIGEGSRSDSLLKKEELMYGATLTPSLEEKLKIYKVATDKYGTWEAHNDLGVVYLKQNKLDEALVQFEIAEKKNPIAALAKLNKGAVLVAQQKYSEAYDTFFKINSGLSNEENMNMKAMKASLEMRVAEYEKAKANMVSCTVNDKVLINKGLAYLFTTHDYQSAHDTFLEVKKDSDLYAKARYLHAVKFARVNRGEELGVALSEAIKTDPNMKEKALNDLEFVKYTDIVNNVIK